MPASQTAANLETVRRINPFHNQATGFNQPTQRRHCLQTAKPICCRLSRLRNRLVDEKLEMLQGTLDLLVLKVVRSRALHGWGISKRIGEISRDVLQVNQGSLYPALDRLERKGLVGAEWGVSDEGRRAKFYQITPLGRKHLTAAEHDWRRFSIAVELVLATA